MYVDLLKQIVKYLKPKEEYYLRFEISTDGGLINYSFYLIYKVNKEIRIKNMLHTIPTLPIINCLKYLNDRYNLDYDNHRIYEISSSNPYVSKGLLIHINKKNSELNIFDLICLPSWLGSLRSVSFLEAVGSLNRISSYDERFCGDHERLETYRLNEKDINSILGALESFQKICKTININDPKNYQLSDKEKKYITINL